MQYGDLFGSWFEKNNYKKTFLSQDYFPTFLFRLQVPNYSYQLVDFYFVFAFFLEIVYTVFDSTKNSATLTFQH